MLRQDLPEAGEANALVGAILWLAQSILGTLQPGDLDTWLRRVGLAGAIRELESEVKRMQTVVDDVKGKAVGNERLGHSLARVKELMYDTDDMVDELDYWRLQHQVQEVMIAPAIESEGMDGDGAGQVDANTGVMLPPASEPEGVNGDRNRHRAEQAGASANNIGIQDSSGRKNRSKAWDHFQRRDPTKAECIYCAAPITVGNGTSGLHKHLKSCDKKRLKEHKYDADDVVDELQQQVQGVMTAAIELEGMVRDGAGQVDLNTGLMLAPASEPEGMNGDRNRDGAEQAGTSASNVGMQNSSVRKNRSKAWDHFRRRDPTKAKCIYCAAPITVGNGTSGLHKHLKSCEKKRLAIEETPNRPSAVDSVQNGSTILTNDSKGRKKMRTEHSVVTTTELWDKADFFKRIQQKVLELRRIRGNVIEYLKDSIARSDQCQINISDTRERTTSSHRGKVYGRDVEKDKIIKVIKAAKSNNIIVLPIVGILGVGKTALAKLIYNDPRVVRKFERKWVPVSNIFDEVRVTREIIDVVALASHEGSRKRESYEGVSNYSKLLEVLKKHVACWSKRFLLVLDDVYDCMDNSQWEDLLDALGSRCTNSNLIIVTTRNLSVAKRLGTIKPVELRALGIYDFLQLFRACAFHDNNYKDDLDTSFQICAKLKGNPLAAKSAVEMLREQPTLEHWKNIIKNGLWESLQLRGGIVTALKNIYYRFPYHLQQCFLVCSLFPHNHQFHIDGLVSLWISLGFLDSIETGLDYLNALVNSCFFEQVGSEDNSNLQQCYVMCGMMHEFARLVSGTEFATIDGLECKEVLPTVRHLSIQTDLVYPRDDCGNIVVNVKFEEKWQSIAPLRRLRTVIFVGRYDSLFVQFKSFHAFISNLVNCTHLRYLKIEYKGTSESLPIPLSKSYHLEILDARGGAIVHDMSDLISIKHAVLTEKACGASSPAWPSYLQTIHLEDCKGWEILPSLESLPSLTKLKLRKMPEVTELSIPSLEELVLIDMPRLERCLSKSVRDLNSSLRVLVIRTCRVLKVFPLFESCEILEIEQKSWLPNVSELTIHECPHLLVSNPLPPSSRSCKLSIENVSTLPKMEGSSNVELEIGSWKFTEQYSPGLTLDDKILSFCNLRTITQLKIVGCDNLWFISLKGFRQLVCLKRLEIKYSTNFFSSDVPSMQALEDMADVDLDALPSLECLIIMHCGITGKWLSLILQYVRALEELHLESCKQITGLLIEGKENSLSSLTSSPRASSQGSPDGTSTRSCLDKLLRVPSNLVPFLKKMYIKSCQLKFQGNKEGFSGFTSLEELTIVECPELISSLVHEDKTNEQANGRWIFPCSLGVLKIHSAYLGTLQPCFPGDVTRLRVLKVLVISGLKSLRLHSCTALEKLTIEKCNSLDALEGVQTLHGLRQLHVFKCPGLPQCLKSLSMQGYELCSRLERLRIDHPSFLTTPFCEHLTSLQCLQFDPRGVIFSGLTREQEAALHLLTSLQELGFHRCHKLLDLPVGQHSLHSLKRLEIFSCWCILSLPERGLPPSLEGLEVRWCSTELTEQCRMLAATTSKLKVIIDENHVN